jgi:hypothetical protein
MGCACPVICIFQPVLKKYINISFYIPTKNLIDLGKIRYSPVASSECDCFFGSHFSPSTASGTTGCLSSCVWYQVVDSCANM